MQQSDLTRRNLLRGSALLGAGAVLGGLPLSGALAKTLRKPVQWPAVTALVEGQVASRKIGRASCRERV